MRTLSQNEIENVEGGILPVLVVIGLIGMSGCATTGKLRRGEEPSGEVVGEE